MRFKFSMGFIFTIIGLVVLPIPQAQAHAALVSATPAINSTLSVLPKSVEVEFDGNLIVLGSAKTNILQVTDASGREIDAGNSKTSGPILSVDLADQRGAGTFTVSWRVVSSDGHPVEGSYEFTVSKGAPAAPTEPGQPTQVTQAHHENFWVHHRDHIYLILAALAFIGIWAEFDRRRRLLD